MGVESSIAKVANEHHASHLAAGKEPFILAGGTALGMEQFVEMYGDARVRISTDEFLLPKSFATLTVRSYREICNQWSELSWSVDSDKLPYAFHDVTGLDARRQGLAGGEREPAAESDALADFVMDAQLPEFFNDLSQVFACVAARVALGPKHTHANIHHHGASLNQLLDGEKRWHIYHPYVTQALTELTRRLRVPNKLVFIEDELLPIARAHAGDISVLVLERYKEWHARGLCSPPAAGDPLWHTPLEAHLVRGIEFTQLPGDSVFLPPGWGHTVENRAWSLCRIFELDRPSDKTRRVFEARRLDERGALLSIRPECRVSVSGDNAVLDMTTTTTVSKLALELALQVDGRTTASEVAARCSDPEGALALLEQLDNVLVTRSTPQTSYDAGDWDQTYDSGAYRERWDTGTPAISTVAFLASGALPARSPILDVGCGAGTDAIYMATLGYQVHAIDPSRTAIRIAQAAADLRKVRVDFKRESVTSMSFASSSMAAVFDRGCLHSLPPSIWGDYFIEVERVLQPHGWLVITGSNGDRSNVTPIRRELMVPFEDKFELRQFETTSMATARGRMPVSFVLMRARSRLNQVA
jgi:SAM-dependent methyltransferase